MSPDGFAKEEGVAMFRAKIARGDQQVILYDKNRQGAFDIGKCLGFRVGAVFADLRDLFRKGGGRYP